MIRLILCVTALFFVGVTHSMDLATTGLSGDWVNALALGYIADRVNKGQIIKGQIIKEFDFIEKSGQNIPADLKHQYPFFKMRLEHLKIFLGSVYGSAMVGMVTIRKEGKEDILVWKKNIERELQAVESFFFAHTVPFNFKLLEVIEVADALRDQLENPKWPGVVMQRADRCRPKNNIFL